MVFWNGYRLKRCGREGIIGIAGILHVYVNVDQGNEEVKMG